MAQPLLGMVATAAVIVMSLAYLTLFDFATFVGWVAFFMLALIPAQIVSVVIAPNPPFAPVRQPVRGVVLLLITIATAVIVTPVVWLIAGGRVSPPGPIPSQYAVIVVPTTFFMAIMFGGWPFVKGTRNMGKAGATILVTAYALTFAGFHVFFNYDFLRGTPVYLSVAPAGLFNAVTAMVFYVTMLAGMFLLLHFDMWPLNRAPAIMRQPTLGVVWLIIATAVAGLVFAWTGAAAMDPMHVLTRITAPFIFGTIIVLNMMENSLFARLAQPLKGVANAVTAAAIGVALGQVFGMAAPSIVGTLPAGPPGYEYELWLVNALLSVTFPFLIFHAAYFGFWPLPRRQPAPAEPART